MQTAGLRLPTRNPVEVLAGTEDLGLRVGSSAKGTKPTLSYWRARW